MVNELTNGSGGSQFDIIFKGQKRYASQRDTLVFNMRGKATDDEIRYAMLENVQLGLVPYLIKTSSKDRMSLFFDESLVPAEDETDPWNNWMFELSGDGSFFNSRPNTMLMLGGSVYISKINPKIKIESSTSFNYMSSEFRMYDKDKKDSIIFRYKDVQRSLYSYNRFVKSMGEHFGLGVIGVYMKSVYSNYKHKVRFGPAIEANLFKYSEASRKQFRICYGLYYERSDYDTLTVNDRWFDNLISNEFKVIVSYNETWGTLKSSIWASCYLNDFQQFDIGSSFSASVNLGKGISFYLTAGFAYSQNQINLPKDQSDIYGGMVRSREMFSELNYRVGIGIAYRFGSIFNNAVNPRFGN
jgi:hypothetical protein